MVTVMYRLLFDGGNKTARVTAFFLGRFSYSAQTIMVTALYRFLLGGGNKTARVTALLRFMQSGRTTSARVTVLQRNSVYVRLR